ncbi:Uncharacterized protein GBIM_15608 [Gryllus bimaculatus]|nr:Uncharacterized protein GBIM_15608 [Gryllus bimaculatus]
MITVMIFIPRDLYDKDSCLLYGNFVLSSRGNIAIFYVLQLLQNVKERSSVNLTHVGQYIKSETSYANVANRSINWLTVGNKYNDLFVKTLVVQGETVNMTSPKIIFITYDLPIFINTELLFFTACEREMENDENYFRTLMYNIKYCYTNISNTNQKTSKRIILFVLEYLILFLNGVLAGFVVLLPVLKLSSLCIRLHNSLESFRWALDGQIYHKSSKLKIGNYVVATLVDIISGYLILYWFMSLVSSTLPSQLLLHSAEEVVHTLQELLKWLMGIPAGLKLNFAFNKMLGKFFVYHINLWWTFLVLAEPVLDFIFFIFLCFGRLGLTFQAAILADLLALASFHVYCIYVYAARLYNLQISGLLALWRLFLGRKKNPLRGRVDSCEYTANQLFIGTLAFTILLFLLPTTFMYYIVFSTMDALIYASLHMQVQTRKSGVPLVLSMTPVRGSLWKTIKKSIPDPVKKPSAIMWGSLLKSIVTGQLIYPM